MNDKPQAAVLDKPLKVRVFRRIVRPLFRGLFHILSRVKVEGVEHVPKGGGYLVVGNHVSIIDPAFMVSFWPEDLEAAGAVAVLERPFQGWLMRSYGALHVHRGSADRAMLEGMVAILKAGRPAFKDPEGERSHKPGMQAAKPGAAYIIGKAGVPVVPVGIIGTEAVDEVLNPLKRPSLRMVIGEPIELPPVPFRSAARKQALRENTDRIMYAIAGLLPEAYRGVYSEVQ